jgi:hypothetical protein
MTTRSRSENFRGRGNRLDGKTFLESIRQRQLGVPANRAQLCVIKLTTNMLYF